MATGFLNRFRRSLALTPTLSRRERGPFKIGFKPCSLHRDQTLSPWVAPDWGQPNHTVRPQNTPAEPQAIAPINGSLYPICRPIGLCHRGPEGLPQLLLRPLFHLFRRHIHRKDGGVTLCILPKSPSLPSASTDRQHSERIPKQPAEHTKVIFYGPPNAARFLDARLCVFIRPKRPQVIS